MLENVRPQKSPPNQNPSTPPAVKEPSDSAPPWHQWEAARVLQELGSEAAGLTAEEARRRLEQNGPNQLREEGIKSPWRILWEQVTATMVIVLIVAAVVSALLGDLVDTIAILVIVALNAAMGFSQEYRAEKAMAALKQLAVPTIRARRGGQMAEILASDLVSGDIALLEAGNLVPADGRLLESASLRIQEAILTGESEAVEKQTEAMPEEEIALGDRRNMAYMGTTVAYGRGVLVVTETGMQTQLGGIAAMLERVVNEATPLQKRLDRLGKMLAGVALVLVAAIFGLGLLRGENPRDLFLTAVSLAVAAIPEGLPAVVTIALALGAQRMLQRGALIRKLPAVETLGSVTVICSDKTGTLTENRMTVLVLDVAGERIDLNALLSGEEPPQDAEPKLPAPETSALALLLIGGALCNDAELTDGKNQVVGDPTEAALLVAAERMGHHKPALEQALPRVGEAPFDSERKRMTTVHARASSDQPLPPALARIWENGAAAGEWIAFTKGAVESLLEVSNRIWVEERVESLNEDWRKRILKAAEGLTQNGMRVLGIAFRPLDAPPETADAGMEQDLIFVGMEGMIDPPRAETKEAVATCQEAGIRPVLITGDHPLTARYVAGKLGFASEDKIQTGRDLDRLSEAELEAVVEQASVYARVSPEHKLDIVRALQRKRHIVAMTGDGVNDAPALKKADIGVAMGITGTDVAKEAADMVLQDDNFATIVAAVQEGRVIYDNTRKFIRYLLTTNCGEIWVMLLAPLLGMPLPLLPLQILWINLVTDGLPALALSLEPAESDVMRRPPHSPDENIFARGLGWHVLWVGVLTGLVSLAPGYLGWRDDPGSSWQTMVFMTLTLAQMAHVLAIRSERDSLFRIGLLSNRALLGAVLLTTLLQLAILSIPLLQGIFQTRPLSLAELGICLAVSSLVFWAVELEKWWRRSHAAVGQ